MRNLEQPLPGEASASPYRSLLLQFNFGVVPWINYQRTRGYHQQFESFARGNRHMFRRTFSTYLLALPLWAIASTTHGAPPTTVQIDTPAQNTVVDQRQEITGRVTPPNATVVVVVHPMENSDYWAQPSVTVGNDGAWSVLVYFGEPGAAHAGKRFEVRAFASPRAPVNEGRTSGWPVAAAQSNVMRYTRRETNSSR